VKLKTERKKIKLFGGNTITKWQHGIFFYSFGSGIGSLPGSCSGKCATHAQSPKKHIACIVGGHILGGQSTLLIHI
jgi:hypothetical protein